MFFSYINTFPEYLRDRSILINEEHQYKVSGFKLAMSSNYFKSQLKDIRSKELERNKIQEELENAKRIPGKRTRTKSLSEIETDCLRINYKDVFGLEFALEFAHTAEEEQQKMKTKLSINNISSILNAAVNFQMPLLVQFCLIFLSTDLSFSNCWQYWAISKDLLERFPEARYKVKSFILKHFIEVSKSDDICDISVDNLISFLKEDELNCLNEKHILPVLDKWILKDTQNRIKYTSKLLECIRLGRLKESELVEFESNRFIKANWNRCEDVLMKSRLSVDEILSMACDSGDEIDTLLYMKTPRLPHAALFVVGGWEGSQDEPNFGPSRAIQVYDPRANEWQRFVTGTFGLDEGHAYSGCVSLQNRIYVIGGYVNAGPTQTLKMFDFQLKQWKYMSPMHEKRNYVCSCSMDGHIYAIGGHNGKVRLASVEKYDPEKNSWVFVAPMNHVRSDAGADSLNSKLYVAGGFDGFHFHSSVEMFDPSLDQWSLVTPMNNVRSGVSAVVFGKHLYVIGGNDGVNRLRTVERFNPETNQWQVMPSMIRQRSNFCVSILEDKIYAMGGWSDEMNSTIALVECWQPDITNEWQSVMHLYMPASANCACQVVGLENVRSHLNR